MNKRKKLLISLSSIILFVLLIGLFLWLIFVSFGIGANTIYWLVSAFVVYIAQVITSFYLLNSKKRIINVKLCWIFVISSIPVFGLFGFFIFGIIPFKSKTIEQIHEDNKPFSKCEDFTFTNKMINEKKDYIEEFIFSYNFELSPVYENNKIDIVKQSDVFKQSIELIRKAKEFIHIQFYIVSDSVWFNLLLEEIAKKRKENVKVRFMYDWVGSHKRFHQRSVRRLRKMGIEVEVFNPKIITKYTSATNFRSHRKCIIVDNKYCLTGGSNIGDEYINMRKKYNNWTDLNFLIEGEIVNSINLRFCNDWINYSSYKKRNDKNDKFYKEFKIHKAENKTIAQIVNSTPEVKPNNFESLLTSLIANAKKSIWITTPYLLLPEHIINQLLFASVRGIDVKIVVPNLPDDKKYILTINRNSSIKMIESNIKVYEYSGFVHSKSIMIDDEISVVGSNNMDFRSLMINFETAILVKSKQMNTSLRNIFNDYLKNSIKIDNEFLKRNYKLSNKIQMLFVNIIQPLL